MFVGEGRIRSTPVAECSFGHVLKSNTTTERAQLVANKAVVPYGIYITVRYCIGLLRGSLDLIGLRFLKLSSEN